MTDIEFIKGYIKGLFNTWYQKVIGLLEFIGFILLIFFPDIGIPRWTIYFSLVLAFILANFFLYKDIKEKSLKENDEANQKIKELTKTIRKHEDNRPKLELLFQIKDGYSQKHIVVVPRLPKQRVIDDLVQQEAEILQGIQNPKNEEPKEVEVTGIEGLMKSVSEIVDMSSALMGKKRKSDDDYQKECEEYIRQYRNYLRQLERYEYSEARFKQLNFAIRNSGHVVGENIVVVIHFPDGFHFPTNEEALELILGFEKPEAPKRPELYKDLFSQFTATPFWGNTFKTPDISAVDTSNVKGPFINPTNSTEVRYEINRVMHNFTEDDFEETGFFIKEEAVGHTHELKFEIHTDALPNPITGNLLLEIKLEEQGGK